MQLEKARFMVEVGTKEGSSGSRFNSKFGDGDGDVEVVTLVKCVWRLS